MLLKINNKLIPYPTWNGNRLATWLGRLIGFPLTWDKYVNPILSTEERGQRTLAFTQTI